MRGKHGLNNMGILSRGPQTPVHHAAHACEERVHSAEPQPRGSPRSPPPTQSSAAVSPSPTLLQQPVTRVQLLLQLPSSPSQRWRSTHRRISLRCTLTTTYSVRGQHRVPHYPRRDRPAGASSSISH
jgi:hypothetical protein